MSPSELPAHSPFSVDPSQLVDPLRIAISLSAVLCAVLFWRALKSRTGSTSFDRALAAWLVLTCIAAALFSHTTLFGRGAVYLSHGVVPGFILAIASLWWKPAVQRFESLTDGNIRLLMSFRALFGAFIFAGAGLGLFPAVFALTAGLGDLLAGWLAMGARGRVDSNGDRRWRVLVHGWGALDLIDVAILATFVVRPWIVESGSPGPSMLLPWVVVPLQFALNLHGLRNTLLTR